MSSARRATNTDLGMFNAASFNSSILIASLNTMAEFIIEDKDLASLNGKVIIVTGMSNRQSPVRYPMIL